MMWQRALSEMPLIAILRGLTPAEAPAIGQALFDAGILAAEVPLNSPDPFDSIALLRKHFDGRMLFGAGTVLSPQDVRLLSAAGGQFVVSPNTDLDVIRATKAAGMHSLPGFFTASEAFAALGAGADALKLFPADAAPPAYLKALKAVLPPEAPVLAVGGVDAARIAPWLAAGAVGFGLGSSLYKPGVSADEVRARAIAFVAAFRGARALSQAPESG